ncbi:[protein-PII] uridylyltransferase [Nitrogeniibacter mangrovi]|uniref:Bifunctional uridylyltransferase/uridylyl-removing enzyme n=1 Tax=Nitrogeniibacter mangrovi TaxID=2016596 RepID=A0A6C1B5G2_9RHOO|nr:[protein-PII] uridylyltransferase [Nitrogeniibacter mangrovi]QID18035.1 [protein-PII] uridylyltransferase [Nitrogeniibacter mangrovi]
MPDTIRPAISAIRNTLKEKEAALAESYEAHPLTRNYLRGRTAVVDEAIVHLWTACELDGECALVATGGYGRGELFPHSDIDLLILLPDVLGTDTEAALTRFVSALWDIGLHIGHSVRTVDECLEVAADDITIQTNLLETRLLFGAAVLLDDLRQRLQAALDVDRFYQAKQLEQDQRYERYEQSPYALEPNCKESPGGLRDLQVLGWISRAAGLGTSWRDLVRHRLITANEAHELRSAERFLQHIRIRLHLLVGRAEDRLLFDHQEKLARAFGVKATEGKRASEVLMQRYYLSAKKVMQLNAILILSYRAEFASTDKPAAFVINEHFQTVRDLLDIRDDELFRNHPGAMFEAFQIMQQRSELTGMTARTLRALWINRRRINAAFRANPHNRRRFIELLQAKRGIVSTFRRMNQYGLLSNYLPPWRKISCQMQHDLFHVYTVDSHTLMVLRNLRRFTMGEHAHEYPLMTQLMLGFDQHWLLYVASLFHDIAKGRGGDHSKLGMVDARRFCEQHGLAPEATDLVEWLVEHHLVMSHVAQKEDISDPAVVQRFAERMGSERRLTALYLLTHADIRGTSPKVWNGWKARLLEDLFHATRRLLRGASPEEALGLDDRRQDAQRLLRYHGLRPGVENALWRKLDSVYFMRHSSEEIAWHTRHLYHRPESDAPVVRARLSEAGEGLQVMVFARDRRDLFMRLCGFFARLGYTILDAKIHTTRHGYALDSFMLQYPGEEAHYREHIALIEHELPILLESDTPVERPPEARLSRHVKHFPVRPSVRLRADESGKQYILTLVAADRQGLLYDVAKTLAQFGVQLHTAKIATLGERVEDAFLVTGRGLSSDSHVLQIERELLKVLTI